MNTENVKAVAVASASLIVTGLSIASYIKVHREEVAKRKEIEKNKNLDIQAIRNSSARISTLIDNGLAQHKSLSQILDDFNNEIEFQKIIIREK